MDGATVDKTGKKIPPSIKDFTSICTEVNVDFTVVFPKGKIQELETSIDANGCNGIEKLLKLFTTISTTNMHMFNADFKLHKYTTIEEIMDEFYGIRLDIYGKRKAYLVDDMEKKLVKLSNRARYIQETLNGTIDLRRKTAEQVTQLLSGMKFALIEGDYKYLIKMPMDSVTQENVANIMKEKENTEAELNILKSTPLEKIWYNELDLLDNEYDKYKKLRENIQCGGGSNNKNVDKKIAKSVKPKK
jgi:DNA topoisomerase-2